MSRAMVCVRGALSCRPGELLQRIGGVLCSVWSGQGPAHSVLTPSGPQLPLLWDGVGPGLRRHGAVLDMVRNNTWELFRKCQNEYDIEMTVVVTMAVTTMTVMKTPQDALAVQQLPDEYTTENVSGGRHHGRCPNLIASRNRDRFSNSNPPADASGQRLSPQ